jgi:hypothetical protein
MGALSLVVAVTYLVALLLSQGGDLLQLVAASRGNRSAVTALMERRLAYPGAIYAFLLLTVVELTLAGILFWTGIALLTLRPSARWCAVFFSLATFLIEPTSTVIQVFFLTDANASVKLLPILLNAAAILFGIHLLGCMFLPSVALTFSEGVPGSPGAEHEEERFSLDPRE